MTTTQEPHVQSHHATIDGVPTRWEESGEGTPVVLVHGIPTSPALWRHVTPLLPDVRVLAFEMVGYGESIPAGRGRDLSVAAQAAHLASWLDHLGIDRAVLVGHDLGGGVVQIAAVRDPARCAGLVLTNSISYDSWPIPSVKLMQRMLPLVERTPDAAFEATLAQLFGRGHDDSGAAREALSVHLRPYLQHGGAAAMARQVEALDVRDTLAVAGQLSSLDRPARVVWGLADQFQKATYGERLARDLGTRPIAIRGGKHFTPEDHPAVIADAIAAVVREVEQAPVVVG